MTDGPQHFVTYHRLTDADREAIIEALKNLDTLEESLSEMVIPILHGFMSHSKNIRRALKSIQEEES
jgi:hypothetical protein